MNQVSNGRARFWQVLSDAEELIDSGSESDRSRAQEMVEALFAQVESAPGAQAESRHATLEAFARLHRLSRPTAADPEVVRGNSLRAPVLDVPGTSVVTCCMNRNGSLMPALRSWLACPEVTEVVIVDWSSDTPVASSIAAEGLRDARIRVVRVEDEPRWVLSRAFNVGFRLVSCENILKADADIVISDRFFRKNAPATDEFVAGNWRTATSGQAHVNGFFFTSRRNILAVNGFNEFITTYGWDDDDLYHRLADLGLRRRDVSPGTIHHVDHSDSSRIGSDAKGKGSGWDELGALPRHKIKRNAILAAFMPAWGPGFAMQEYGLHRGPDGALRARAVGPTPELLNAELSRTLDVLAAYQELATRFGLGTSAFGLSPSSLDGLLSSKQLDAIGSGELRKMMSNGIRAPRVETARRPRLFIDAQHGLGNRLRAIGSAACVAASSDMELVIVWQPDDHCQCRFGDLFIYSGAVEAESHIEESRAAGAAVFNYMEVERGAVKDQPIEAGGRSDVYVRSAYALNSRLTHWNSENRFLQSLNPVPEVVELLQSVRNPNDVSVHIRMVGGTGHEHLAFEARENWTEEGHQQIDYWRNRSHYSHFIKRIDEHVRKDPETTVFVAADNAEAYEQFEARYGGRISALKRTLYDRSAEQLRYALADAILLGRSPLLLGSNWSSFTELAVRLSKVDTKLLMSGRDF